MRFTRWLGIAAALIACGVHAPQHAVATPQAVLTADAELLERHLTTLAHDSMLGRAPGTRGFDLSAAYVARLMRQAGLNALPGRDMMVDVPLVAARLERSSVRLSILGDGATRAFAYAFGTQFIVGGSFRERELVDAAVVHVGQGVVAPWRQHDDYAGLDVRGKFVAFTPGAPNVLTLEERAYVEQMKVHAALAKGAIGTIQLSDTSVAADAWATGAAPYAAIPTIGVRYGSEVEPSVFGAGTSLTLGPEASRILLTRGLQARVTLQSQSKVRSLRSANVAGFVRGSDPVLSREYVVVSAHLDHLGVGTPVNGDSIYNGAVDNASGVAMLLEAARIIAHAKPAPKRSVLFVAFTAEEAGGLGSEHFVRSSPVPRDAVAAAVNLDGGGVWPFVALVARGAEFSNLGAAVENGAAELSLKVVRDLVQNRAAMPGSDQFAFASHGIPVVALSSARGDAGRAQAIDWVTRRYHQPSDDLQQPIDDGAAAKLTDAIAHAVLAIANTPVRPAWRDGVFYGTFK